RCFRSDRAPSGGRCGIPAAGSLFRPDPPDWPRSVVSLPRLRTSVPAAPLAAPAAAPGSSPTTIGALVAVPVVCGAGVARGRFEPLCGRGPRHLPPRWTGGPTVRPSPRSVVKREKEFFGSLGRGGL